ncbi:Uncharacterized protein TCM_038001 [Theobroma cacao]|uniref:Uncharacterized protein n=1 Tax=Theobroma cacao TaxID=3641 RepID=A0A061GUY9_THECC|nr:Uncharacterized protein TCM_038001 [Theobroma cacao]
MGCFCQKTCLGFDYFSEPDTWTGLSATWDRIEDLMDLKANLPTKLIEKPSLEFKGNSCRLVNMFKTQSVLDSHAPPSRAKAVNTNTPQF